MSFTTSELRPVEGYLKTLGLIGLGALSLLSPAEWCVWRCKRCCRPCQQDAHDRLVACNQLFTCCQPESEEEEEGDVDRALSREMLAINARKWDVKTIQMAVPVMLGDHAHMFLHQEVPSSALDKIIVWLSLAIRAQVEKDERRRGVPESIPSVLIKSIVVGTISVIMVKLETELFFIIEPYAWWAAAGTLVVSALVAKPVVSYSARLATAMINAIKSCCSQIYGCTQSCCTSCWQSILGCCSGRSRRRRSSSMSANPGDDFTVAREVADAFGTGASAVPLQEGMVELAVMRSPHAKDQADAV